MKRKRFSAYISEIEFRNQPFYKHYSKCFEDEADVLFLGLNEIHSFFLVDKDDDLICEKSTDPRNKMPIPSSIIDHTKKCKPKIFFSPFKSALTKAQHIAGLKVLQARQCKDEIYEEDQLIFRNLAQKRQKEKVEFLRYVKEFTQAQRESIYKATKPLLALYGSWYQRKVKLLTQTLANKGYNTHIGLPHTRACSVSNNIHVEDVCLLSHIGNIVVWQPDVFYSNAFRNKFDTYARLFTEEIENIDKVYTNKDEAEIMAEADCTEFYKYSITLEGLLFLLTAGDYSDLPNEMLFDIEDGFIRFYDPLPARNSGWHTYTKVVEQAFYAFQAVAAPTVRWKNLGSKSKLKNDENNGDERTRYPKMNYKPELFSEYIKKLPNMHKSKKFEFNQLLIKWHLDDRDRKEMLQIYTKLQQPLGAYDQRHDSIGGVVIKLEYKPQFGCEIMTKYELLREWLILRLLTTHEPQVLHRLHLSVNTLELLLTERLELVQIEKQLLELYDVEIKKLVSNLHCFLKRLQKIPTGHYMLRFSEKFHDKILLCVPSKEISQHTIFLDSLVQTKPSDVVFITKNNFLPIADDICSAVHSCYRVLPCAFLPDLKKELENSASPNQKRSARASQSNKAQFNDRDFILSQKKKRTFIVKSKNKMRQKSHKKKHNRKLSAKKIALNDQ